MADIVLYGGESIERVKVKFIKFLCSNPTRPPYYAPAERQFIGRAIGPIYDGKMKDNYEIHDRYETEPLFDEQEIAHHQSK